MVTPTFEGVDTFDVRRNALRLLIHYGLRVTRVVAI